ncbi:Uncharacterised protein [Yersinia frederiksenii]|nr:Uncharacterised protein [Yersinia frederiksenii]
MNTDYETLKAERDSALIAERDLRQFAASLRGGE